MPLIALSEIGGIDGLIEGLQVLGGRAEPLEEMVPLSPEIRCTLPRAVIGGCSKLGTMMSVLLCAQLLDGKNTKVYTS